MMLRVGRDLASVSEALHTFLTDHSIDLDPDTVRAMETGNDKLDLELDYAQSDVFTGSATEAFVIVRITRQ